MADSIKQETRERMAWSGERYSVARRKVIELRWQLREALEATARGETEDLGDFSQYLDEDAG